MRMLQGPSANPTIAHNYMQMTTITAPKRTKPNPPVVAIQSTIDETVVVNYQNTTVTSGKKRSFTDVETVIEDYQDATYKDDACFGNVVAEASEATTSDEEEASDESEGALECDKSLRKSFQDFVLEEQSAHAFTKAEVTGLTLLHTLRKSKSPLNMYETLMHWHLTCNGNIHQRQPVSQSSSFISRDKLFKKLRKRYKYNELYHQVTKITLPHSKAKAQIVWNDAKEVLTSLLTDPRITDDDYLFFENSPLASPPARLNFVEEVNTGRAYTRTYKELIERPGEQVLLPVIFYIDGATTGQFADLPVTAVKISLGIFSRKAREKDHLWRILGYIPAVMKHKSKGRRIMLDSMHVDGVMAHQDALEDEGVADNNAVSKAQDFHSMLEVVLNSYVKLQNTGFIWDLPYKGKIYKDIEFVLFTPFVKSDGEEADKLCGKYLSRTSNVSQLCRYCECPTDSSDDPMANYPLKTKAKINGLIRHNNWQKLRELSQHNIKNALHAVRFGCHNKQEVHGACPVEMLHAILLGLFKYTRDCFFEQIGETSQLADEINGLAKQYGALLSRQSDRDLPVTRFANGIKRGKLMANEYPGILLCMAAVLRSTGGRNRLQRKKTGHFADDNALRDWSQLVETFLQWERWLKSSSMEKRHVKEARDKHRYIMYLMKKVVKRSTGMQMKLTKFHGVVHMADDILNFGVPMEVDTGFNESGHKATKTAARLTQKREETFDYQTAIRLEEVHLLDLAILKIEEGKRLCDYGEYDTKPALKSPPSSNDVPIGGAELTVSFDQETHKYAVTMKNVVVDDAKPQLETGLVTYIAELQSAVKEYIPQVPLRTLHKRKGQIFRGQNWYRDGVWRDWALIDWGDEGHLPNKIWGFVDLRGIPDKKTVIFKGMPLEKGIYAVVESAAFVEDKHEIGLSEIFVPIIKEVAGLTDNAVSSMSFLLADVEAIVQAIAVVPDIGGAPNAYF